MITFDDFKPNTNESEHSECVFPVLAQHKLPSRPVVTIRSHTHTRARNAVARTRTNLYTRIAKQRERGVNNRAWTER